MTDNGVWFRYFAGPHPVFWKSKMPHKFFDPAFSPGIKAAQEHYGTRRNYERFEGCEPDLYGLTDAKNDFIEARDGFYMATVGENGHPYIQFRGGPRGFLNVPDDGRFRSQSRTFNKKCSV